jgi:rubrerythrin
MRNDKTTDRTATLVGILHKWQGLEDATVTQTTAIIEKTHNPLIRTVMEIIRSDSQMHKRVQQVMLDGLEKQAFSLTPEELGDIWDMVERHAEMERETIRLAEEARKSCRLFVHRHLLSYLLDDERKHDRLLTDLEDFKRGIYPYA